MDIFLVDNLVIYVRRWDGIEMSDARRGPEDFELPPAVGH